MKNNKEENVLIIAASGGAGLLVAARAKEQEIKKNNPKAKIIFQDFMFDLSWKWIAVFWNFCLELGTADRKCLVSRGLGFMSKGG